MQLICWNYPGFTQMTKKKKNPNFSGERQHLRAPAHWWSVVTGSWEWWWKTEAGRSSPLRSQYKGQGMWTTEMVIQIEKSNIIQIVHRCVTSILITTFSKASHQQTPLLWTTGNHYLKLPRHTHSSCLCRTHLSHRLFQPLLKDLAQ